MPSITINGMPCPYDGKKTILEIALENRVAIPYYCYHPGLSIVASCRICLAQVAQPDRQTNKLVMIPKLLPTCQTMAVDGMAVYSQSPKAIANQKAVMEYMLIHHPLDCPVCDQAGECYLQDYSYKYGRGQSRFEEQKIKQPIKDIGPHVKLYSDRCIMCSRCVRFTREVSGTGEIGVVGRGDREQIDVFPGRPLDNELSGNVVDICPVGALLDKDFLFRQRVWFLTETPSIDPVTASGDNVWIDHNEGTIYRLRPRPNPEVNRWWISDQIRYGWKFVHHPARLRSPTRKLSGPPEECDWNRAYELVAARFKQLAQDHAPGWLALMVSPMLTSEEAYLLGKLAMALDSKATLGIGPVPVVGEDKKFPDGYRITAEKCPNRRGVSRALARISDEVLQYEPFVMSLKNVHGVVLTGNYSEPWTTKALKTALGNSYVVLIDTLPGDLNDRADILLPGATWAEKAGTFENVDNRLQCFEQAIAVIELAKSEGQIALDLLAVCGLTERARFDAARVRMEMDDEFVHKVHHPDHRGRRQPDMKYVEF